MIFIKPTIIREASHLSEITEQKYTEIRSEQGQFYKEVEKGEEAANSVILAPLPSPFKQPELMR